MLRDEIAASVVRWPDLVVPSMSSIPLELGDAIPCSRQTTVPSQGVPGPMDVRRDRRLPGTDHYIWEQNAGVVADEIEEFLTGVRRGREVSRTLKTLVFTDIVGSTDRARELGDDRWHQLLDRHEALGSKTDHAVRGTVRQEHG
jgi:class 3 adenylate cyclase